MACIAESFRRSWELFLMQVASLYTYQTTPHQTRPDQSAKAYIFRFISDIIVCYVYLGIDLMVFNTLKEQWVLRSRASGSTDLVPGVGTLVSGACFVG